ncbi:MAG TPA: glycosyltransferase family 4 protein [Pyrinomonadaceae bacterium]|nr:glycosyltransferase family 4 protein [Pyrinomonadaceae bacterium]
MRSLYICYFGVREPLVQTQVLPYLRELRRGGVEASLLTFEPGLRDGWGEGEQRRVREELAAEGIRWLRLPYHKRPTLPATVYDIAAGGRLAARLVREHGIEILHARNHVAAAMGLIAKRMGGGRLIFDIRGFMPEEYVDAGVWRAGGLLYRLTKAAERRLLKAADGFVVLTERAREILFAGRDTDDAGRPVEVIPCCVDVSRFRMFESVSRDDVRAELGLEGRRVLVYVGALGGWYLTDEMADLLAAAHGQDASSFSLILTQNPPEEIASRLRARGVADSDFLISKVSPGEVPRYLKAADLAISFIKPCYSKLSSSPTKLAEYLAAGLPVICNAGIGDVDSVVEGDRVGVVVRELSRESYREALRAADALRGEGDMAARCRASAERRFDLEKIGGERYRRLYERVMLRGESDALGYEGRTV